LSFHVKSSITGNYVVSFLDSGNDNGYVAGYTINSANTWEKKTITLTMSDYGSWVGSSTNLTNLILHWDLGSGPDRDVSNLNVWNDGAANDFSHSSQVDWVGTTGSTFYLTGVQLEVGEQATPFEHRSFGEELALCQRYYQWIPKYTFMVAVEVGTDSVRGGIDLATNMRANPAIGSHNLTRYDDDDNTFSNKTPVVFSNSGSDNQSDPEAGGQSGHLALAYNNIMSGGTDNHNVTTLFSTKASLDAEL